MPGQEGVKKYLPGETRHKSFSGLKGASKGVEVTSEILAKINKFALEDVTPDQVYVRKQILAHNGVDRDRERFPEDLLDDFARTLPGKSTLYSHEKRKFLPLGLYFDATTEGMSAEQFKALTGEDPRLPESVASVKVLWAWYYVIKTPSVEDTLANISGGTYRHWSIGFSASDLNAVKGEHGQVLYWEYKGPGEATEGSLVWLGAQQGATSQKAAKEQHKSDHDGGIEKMKKLLALLGKVLGKSFGDDTSEETLVDAVKSAISEKDTRIEALEKELSDSKALIEEGKEFRKGLVDDFARMKAALGECEESEEATKQVKGYAAGLPIAFLQSEVKHLQARMDEKFPDGKQLGGDDRRDKSAGDGDNPLVPPDDK